MGKLPHSGGLRNCAMQGPSPLSVGEPAVALDVGPLSASMASRFWMSCPRARVMSSKSCDKMFDACPTFAKIADSVASEPDHSVSHIPPSRGESDDLSTYPRPLPVEAATSDAHLGSSSRHPSALPQSTQLPRHGKHRGIGKRCSPFRGHATRKISGNRIDRSGEIVCGGRSFS